MSWRESSHQRRSATKEKRMFKHCYTEERHQIFARLSGDQNPMHVDPVAARRTLVGTRAVHGIHQTLSAMEGLLAWLARGGKTERGIVGVKSQFLKAVGVDETVGFSIDRMTDDGCRITGQVDDEIACRTTVRFGKTAPRIKATLFPLVPEPVIELTVEEIRNKSGHLALGIDTGLARQLFPRVLESLGEEAVAATLALSRLVGMRCPGLHSIFGEATVDYDGSGPVAQLDFQVTDLDDRFGRVTMAISGGGLRGNLLASIRPAPVAQAGMATVGEVIKPGEFKNSLALIVGGSRGLGEITARLIAAGGGLPIITYHQGADDAEKVAEDIRASSGRCEVRSYDIRKDDSFIDDLSRDGLTPRSLYYFATPKIFGRRRGFFDYDLLRDFQEVYVTAFGRLVDRMAVNSPAKLQVFYPSSVAVTENLRKMAEYAMAKGVGEELCAYYNSHAQVEITVERLPRIRTDQTSTLTAYPAADALEVMLPLVRRLEGRVGA
jgi:hypothetical protein